VARHRLSPSSYRKITGAAVLALSFIIVTGAAVRLTGSGLGCPDWPTCAGRRVVAPWQYHAMVEFTNRSVTGLVSVLVILAVLGSLIREPRRGDLTWLSAGLVTGVVAQIVLGGLTVLFKLAPPFVMAHFLLSMAIVADAVVLHHRAGYPDGPRVSRPAVDPSLLPLGPLLVAACGLVLFLGTVVTSSGPHGGDIRAKRLPFALHDVARLHGSAVMLFVALTVVSLGLIWRSGGPGAPELLRRGEILLVVLAAQTAIGYAQYFTRIPPLLVGFHIAGAVSVWVSTLWFVLALRTVAAVVDLRPAPDAPEAPDSPAEAVLAPT
jgi:cytochrome c oxidase assembly protein subunit 15